MKPLVLAALLLAAPAGAAEILVPQGRQAYQDIIIKDQPMRARLALGFDAALILNLEPAQRANLKIFPLIGKQTFKDALIPGGRPLSPESPAPAPTRRPRAAQPTY